MEKHSKETLDFAECVCSGYDAAASRFRQLIEMEAVSDGSGEALDAGYLQGAYYYFDIATMAVLGVARRAWGVDIDERGKLYAEMNGEFWKKANEYREKIDGKLLAMDALRAVSKELCAGGKDSKKIAKGELDFMIERKKSEMMPQSVVKDASPVGYA